MSYNGSGTFVINSTGQPVVTGTVISSSTFNSLTADLGTGLSTAITKDGQTTTTAKIPFAQGLSAAVASNFAAGTVGAPSIYLSTDTTTGLYRIGANNVGFAISGVKLLDLGSALVGVTGALTVSTTLGVTGTSTLAAVNASGKITSTVGNTSIVLENLSATTGYQYMRLVSTGASALLGIDSSVGGVLGTGTAPYSTVLSTQNATSLHLVSNAVVGLTLASGGAVTIPGTLGVTGAGFTFSGVGLGNFGTTTSGAGIGTTLQSFTFDSSTASGASPHDICATFKNDTAAGQTLILWNAVNSGDPSWIKFYTEPTGSASLRGSINYNRTGGLTAYNTTSDYRAKNIAGPLENTGATIDKLKVYLGTMKGATIARPMLIAHEAQAIVPYAVTGTKDQVDKNGEPEFQQMDHQSFVPLLLAEIQSLRTRLAALEAK